MKTIISKRLYLAMILLIGMGLLLVSATSFAGSPGQQDASTVRQPQKNENLEAFWDKFDWADLTSREQALWQKLGWDEASWQGESEQPASESKSWNDLTTEERTAAEQLGYDAQSWDSPLN